MKFREMAKEAKILYTLTLCILSLGLGLSIALPLRSGSQPMDLPTAVETEAVVPPKTSETLQFQKERQQIRDQEKRELQAILDDERADAQLRAEAGQRMMSLLGWIEQETTIEGVMRIRGYLDPVVTVHQDSANVLFRAEQVTREQSAQLLDLVSRETGLRGGNIKIIPIS